MLKNTIGNLLLLGPPGAGKGTQAQFLAKEYDLERIDTGTLIRSAIAEGNELGQKAKEFVTTGKLVPDSLVIDLILVQLQKVKDSGKNFLLDGFPRNVAQAEALERALTENELALNYAIEIEADHDKIVKRIAGRRLCTSKTCNAVYHLEFSPPKKPGICDICGSPLYQRDDDKAELVASRLDVYKKETFPLVAFYKNKGSLIRINGNQSTLEVSKEIVKLLKNAE
jgi:adenylate kinase